MNGEILTPSQECLTNIPAISSQVEDFQLLGGGSIQLNYRYRDIGVLHISSSGRNLSPDEALICNRWINSEKGSLVAQTHNVASNLYERVTAPKVISFGVDTYGGYPYWYDTFVQGTELTQLIFSSQEDVVITNYYKLIHWLARFHESQSPQAPLRKYYKDRLMAFRSIFQTERFHSFVADADVELLISLVKKAGDNLPDVIEPSEQVCVVHGDLHGENILINGEDIIVLDFEQGLDGGDWYTDINKLLNPQSDSMPDSQRRYRYVAPVTALVKRQLLLDYSRGREKRGWIVPRFLGSYIENGDRSNMEKRSRLCALDNMLSVLVLRYLSNWNFYVNEDTGQRGTLYVMEFIRSKRNRYF